MSDEKTSQPINVERLRDFATSLEARIDKCINLLRLTIAKLQDQKKLLK